MTAAHPTHEIIHTLTIIAQQAALSVSPYLRDAVRKGTSFETKTDFHDSVTVHDRIVEQALRGILGNAVLGSLLLGEEAGLSQLRASDSLPDPVAIPSDQEWSQTAEIVADLGEHVRWIVDPIDGTSNFAAGMPWINTSIGAEYDGHIVAGVVYAPLMRELFCADDQDAWYETPDGSGPLTADGLDCKGRAVLNNYYPSRKDLKVNPKLQFPTT
ncbi:inositol monophosphatase family protein [Schaalia vaccimaxillae]|uniref:inositol monophosphatase family protein n=1 Tax=Schaalia vaccimaxillae TaxID=183916 RepID=UPI0003B50446|nr:inositol monophosphatase family protein [Schaalia vaccimaxillae]